MSKVMVVDDDADLCRALASVLTAKGHQVSTAESGSRALEMLGNEPAELLLLDLHLGDIGGLDLLKKVRAMDPELPVVILTGDTGIPSAVRAMKMGALDYLTKPCRNEEVAIVVERALQERALEHEVHVLRERLSRRRPSDPVLGQGPAMRRVFEEIARIAPTDLTVILQGESGTGKELIARRIHETSPRSEHDFVTVDCGTLPEPLMESELFGHEKGAFTGAHQRKLGQFELALGGTLFLDEIANLPYSMQAKLLRAIQERHFRRVGGKRDISSDARILVASNVDLNAAVRQGKFREDLYHRLNQYHILLPPLRERREDIPVLSEHFLKEANRTLKKRVEKLSPEALELLVGHPWPGNVRELKNVVTRAALLADDVIGPAHLAIEPQSLSPKPAGGQPVPPSSARIEGAGTGSRHISMALKKVVKKATAGAEKGMIREALRRADGNKVLAAKLLGINRMTLYLKLKKYGLFR